MEGEHEIEYVEAETNSELVHIAVESFDLASRYVSEGDEWKLTKADEQRINRIKKRSLRIIDYVINEISETLFETEDE